MKPYLLLPVQAADRPAFSKSKTMGILTKYCATAPAAAIIPALPCLSSAARNLRKPSLSPTLQKPRGSKKPMGSVTPICFAGSKGGGFGFADPSASGTSSGSIMMLALLAEPLRCLRLPAARAPKAATATAEAATDGAGAAEVGAGVAAPAAAEGEARARPAPGATKSGAAFQAAAPATTRHTTAFFFATMAASRRVSQGRGSNAECENYFEP
mmetsp:Transcript_78524/g.199782  ORF Transcript_78524/g.199782 Transcript_78524/m.199782 type:complete len:213 (-) Transcript_78524:3-641(-)